MAKQNYPPRHAPAIPTVKEMPESNEKIIRMLLPRLERISVDSYWAHRASGVRGALTKILEQMETGEAIDPESVRTNLLIGFEILKEAAEEYL
jgi:hypothetical protein